MSKKSIHISGKMPAIPDWVKINSTLSFPLYPADIKKLSKALSEAENGKAKYANVELSFTGGLDITLDVSYDLP